MKTRASNIIRVLCMPLINHVNRLAGKGSPFARKMTPQNFICSNEINALGESGGRVMIGGVFTLGKLRRSVLGSPRQFSGFRIASRHSLRPHKPPKIGLNILSNPGLVSSQAYYSCPWSGRITHFARPGRGLFCIPLSSGRTIRPPRALSRSTSQHHARIFHMIQRMRMRSRVVSMLASVRLWGVDLQHRREILLA